MFEWLAKLLTDFWQLPVWEKVWLAIGFAGQLVFTTRFIVQWIVSERHKRSVIPVAFWYLSLAGSLTLLSYAIHKRDPVFILGLSLNSLIYIRNLSLIYRPGRATPDFERESRSKSWAKYYILLSLDSICWYWSRQRDLLKFSEQYRRPLSASWLRSSRSLYSFSTDLAKSWG